MHNTISHSGGTAGERRENPAWDSVLEKLSAAGDHLLIGIWMTSLPEAETDAELKAGSIPWVTHLANLKVKL